MATDKWLAKHCKKCSDDPQGLRTKCPRHCTCPKGEIGTVEDFTAFRAAMAELAKQDVPPLRLVKR